MTLDHEVARYREAARLTLEQLEWCVVYLHRIRKTQIARAVAANSSAIARSLRGDTESPSSGLALPGTRRRARGRLCVAAAGRGTAEVVAPVGPELDADTGAEAAQDGGRRRAASPSAPPRPGHDSLRVELILAFPRLSVLTFRPSTRPRPHHRAGPCGLGAGDSRRRVGVRSCSRTHRPALRRPPCRLPS